ncbi:TetR/AcrR family transcriptional regulator [Sporichthya brevicatena]|uniref:TetR/AcrR family transcriptional regulator n=1 Tax=Sporichthya brevicatena TaxID=171442 RepID=A0ABP3RCH0_9ACTN
MGRSAIEARRRAALEEGNVGYLARRQEIIQAAKNVFRERGFEATLRDVAEVLGTDRASLYYYVGSKDELLQEIVREALARDIAAAKAVQKSKASTPDKIRELILSMVKSYSDNYPHMNVNTEDLRRYSHEKSDWAVEVITQTREYEAIVMSILNKGRTEKTLRRDLPVNVSALALFGMINWMHRWYRPTYPVAPEEIARTFAEIYLSGYAATE